MTIINELPINDDGIFRDFLNGVDTWQWLREKAKDCLRQDEAVLINTRGMPQRALYLEGHDKLSLAQVVQL